MSILTAEDFLNGQILLIDKPLGWSSFQAVNKLKWAIRKKFQLKKIKIGHAGTLDPLATGLLIICTGKFTKRIEGLQGQIKEYTGTITLGATTPSYDLETEIDATFPTGHLTEADVRRAASKFIGDIEQRPPIFSAIKKDGKRLYEYARKGKEVEIKTRRVSIYKYEITGIRFPEHGLNPAKKKSGHAEKEPNLTEPKMLLPEVDFRIVCSKGTYIRSLAHDLGQVLQNGGHLTKLRRTRIGEYYVDKAIDPVVFAGKLLENP